MRKESLRALRATLPLKGESKPSDTPLLMGEGSGERFCCG